MKTQPESYKFHNETIMTNFDDSIDYSVANEIKDNQMWAYYTAWDFIGHVWHQDALWHCAVYRYGVHQKTFSEVELRDLMSIVQNEFGND